jgi:hypothetical protein
VNLPTIIRGLPEADYRAHPAFANSDLKTIRTQSPAHLQWRRTHPDKDTPAKREGRILHCAILEPHAYNARYTVLPSDAPDKPTAAMIEAAAKGTANPNSVYRVTWWADWNASNPNKELIAAEDYDRHMYIAEAIRTHPELRAYFEGEGESELSVFATDPITGLPVKCRPDRRVQVGGFRVVLDIKSAESAQPEAFERACENYGYWQGAAFYTDVNEWAGDPLDLYLLVAFEKEGPYGVTVHEVSPEAMNDGRAQYRAALDLAKHCVDTGEWPPYDPSIRVAQRPAWARGRA